VYGGYTTPPSPPRRAPTRPAILRPLSKHESAVTLRLPDSA
jgi:hypothetical protein